MPPSARNAYAHDRVRTGARSLLALLVPLTSGIEPFPTSGIGGHHGCRCFAAPVWAMAHTLQAGPQECALAGVEVHV
jgi:hypothetical protein